eukprot:s3318_g7.t1
MALETIQKISMAGSCHKDDTAQIEKWFVTATSGSKQSAAKRGAAFSAASLFKMVARSSWFRLGVSAHGIDFCMWMVTMMMLFNGEQLCNSRSNVRTFEKNLDSCSCAEHGSFAGLAWSYNLCMRQCGRYETCSAVGGPEIFFEPNAEMLHVPSRGFNGLAFACNSDVNHGRLQLTHRTVWTEVTGSDSWCRSPPGSMNCGIGFSNIFQYHSGNFNNAAAVQVISDERDRFSVMSATPDYFECNAGKFHMYPFQSDSGNFYWDYFQGNSGNIQLFHYDSGYFNFAMCSLVFDISSAWLVRMLNDASSNFCKAVQFQPGSELGDVCSETESTNGFQNLLGPVADWYGPQLLQFLVSGTGMQLLIVALTFTTLVCCLWYSYLQMSHLSYDGDVRSRTCKRLHRRSAIRQQKQLVALLFLCSCANARAMDEAATNVQTAFLQGMTSMAEAATRAAAAAERALERTTAGSSGSNDGLSAASRILKAPDVFSGDDPMLFQQWKQQFTSCLCFGDSRYSEALDALEKKTDAPPISAYNADEKDMSQKLFAVLTSYLRGRCAHLVRAEAKTKDGFKLWHTLTHEYMPNTRQRALALAQALSAYPAFGKDKTTLESILAFEQLVIQYEEANGSTYPLELMSATLIRCCQPKLREQLQLAINDESTYKEIRDKVLSFERVSKIWSTEQVLKHIQETPTYTGGTADGPTPMEVDRVEKGGKSKGKGKNKGKGFSGGEWLNAWGYARGRGRGRQNKGKGKGKLKGKSKGKKGGGNNKGKGKKGGRGKVAYGQCSNCYEFGHWAKDCPHMVNQVKQDPIAPNATAASSSQAVPKASSSPVVRRIFQFGGSAPSSLTSPSPTSPAASQVRMVLFQDLDSDWTQVAGDSSNSEWVILDSGSDVSLLPSRFQVDGASGLAPGTLQNCQGSPLQTSGVRKAELITTTLDGEEVRKCFCSMISLLAT